MSSLRMRLILPASNLPVPPNPNLVSYSMASISPTFYGHVASNNDALLLFEACLSGFLNFVGRRPEDHKRVSLIKSGNIFLYSSHSSKIERWTDGVPWSLSRVLGDFLVYRELKNKFRSGEKRKALDRKKRSLGISKQNLQKPFGR